MRILSCSSDRRGGHNDTNGRGTGHSGHGVAEVNYYAGSGIGGISGAIEASGTGDGGGKGSGRATNQFGDWRVRYLKYCWLLHLNPAAAR